MQPSRIDKRLLLLGGVVIVGLLIFGITALFSGNNNSGEGEVKDFTDQSGKYDPDSKEVISDPKGKTPDVYGTNADAPAYYGLDTLLTNSGLTMEQIQDFKYAFYQYLNTNNKRADEVSIVVATIDSPPINRDTEEAVREVITFDISVDNKATYKAKMEYFDLESIQLYLSDTAGKQIHDSGVVTNQTL